MSKNLDTITELDEIFKHRNINGDIYYSDVSLWLGDHVPSEIKKNIWTKINKVIQYVEEHKKGGHYGKTRTKKRNTHCKR